MTPRWQNRPPTLRSRLAAALLRLSGWTALLPAEPSVKLVGVAYPHTSNWDLLPALLWARATGTPLKFVAKHSLFRPPLGLLIRAWGGVSVDRRKAGGNFVEAVAQMIAAQPEIVLGLAPEGTREKADAWKSGFYHMSQAAGVPIALIVFDWRRKRVGVLGYLTPSNDMEADYQQIRAVYQGVEGKHPQKATPIRSKAVMD
ncbi:glycerol acyltransferase [Deinococcus detaillensis]|uniref:Glycerol acyltransferase n=1 Tax=Deinococcus detaillensis TaxID=2592048 RepID=A0A553V309_9DEIO|nr:1-acyl-sn-glycerol-3-phosphate acyltransferase [Deinococcus detaillensis]TSA86830.1 glycerol acyltransferase [Deinococcus detaillensis]